MANERILITGATGKVGSETIRELMKHPDKTRFDVVAAVRNPDKSKATIPVQPDGFVTLDFADAATFDTALSGINRVFLVRPPELTDVDNYFRPFVAAMKSAGVLQVTFLSVQGAEHNTVMPHHKIEKLLVEAGLEFTFLRPGFFMQNLCGIHRDEIRLRNELFIPAGNGRTSFIDVRDVAAVAAVVLTSQTKEHFNRGYELTGPEALTYYEVAQILTKTLGRPITYQNPSALRFIWRKWRHEQLPLGYTLLMSAIYTMARLGKAAGRTEETERLAGRRPISFRQFAADYRSVWAP